MLCTQLLARLDAHALHSAAHLTGPTCSALSCSPDWTGPHALHSNARPTGRTCYAPSCSFDWTDLRALHSAARSTGPTYFAISYSLDWTGLRALHSAAHLTGLFCMLCIQLLARLDSRALNKLGCARSWTTCRVAAIPCARLPARLLARLDSHALHPAAHSTGLSRSALSCCITRLACSTANSAVLDPEH